MTREEFEKKLSEIGFHVVYIRGMGRLLASQVWREHKQDNHQAFGGSYIVFSIDETQWFSIDVEGVVPDIEIDELCKLFKIVIEYAKTPIEEREETKKYYLRLPEFFNDEWAYLNYWVEGNEYFFNDKLLKEVEQTQFTQEEIDKLPNQDFIKTLIKEEVEE